jgi:sigma-70-like protein
MGVNVVETKEAEPEETPEDAKEEPEGEERDGELMEVRRSTTAETKRSEPGERTDDPVRMYLREMGSVELLSREGEIAIAKRIEAGREAMITGLCESPLTFQAIIIWRDELNDGRVFLRDIIDLEATYAGPDAKAVPAIPAGDGAAAPEGGGRPCGSRYGPWGLARLSRQQTRSPAEHSVREMAARCLRGGGRSTSPMPRPASGSHGLKALTPARSRSRGRKRKCTASRARCRPGGGVSSIPRTTRRLMLGCREPASRYRPRPLRRLPVWCRRWRGMRRRDGNGLRSCRRY